MSSINSINAQQVNTYSTEAAKPAAPAQQTATPAVTGEQDQAKLSSASSFVSQALSGSDSDVRTDKVAALQQQISSGTYNVPASEVAGKIVDSLLS